MLADCTKPRLDLTAFAPCLKATAPELASSQIIYPRGNYSQIGVSIAVTMPEAFLLSSMAVNCLAGEIYFSACARGFSPNVTMRTPEQDNFYMKSFTSPSFASPWPSMLDGFRPAWSVRAHERPQGKGRSGGFGLYPMGKRKRRVERWRGVEWKYLLVSRPCQ